MAITITMGIQKGGTGKSVTTGMLAYILSREHKVLAVDMDSQGNLTELLTNADDLDVFQGETILEALQAGDVRPYVKVVDENLHLVPADDFLATLSRWIYGNKAIHRPIHLLRDALKDVEDYYDYILIDTPPALSEQTLNALVAADYVVILFESSKFCYSAVKNFLATVDVVREDANPDVKIAGLLRTLIDNRRKDAKELIGLVAERYSEYTHIFNTIITRSAHVGRLSIAGFVDNPELSKAVGDYLPFVEELLERVK